MSLIVNDGEFVNRDTLTMVPTPYATQTWQPVPHIDVVNAVTDVVRAKDWSILGEQYGLSHEGKKMFGVMRVSRTNSPEWTRCIGIRNSHDKSLAVGLTAGICVLVCSNLCFSGSIVLYRRHTSRIDLNVLVQRAVDELEEQFLTLETVAEDLKLRYIKDNDARVIICKAAETGAINSSDIVPVFREYKNPSHDEFSEPTRWSLLNAFTENAKKYSPARADYCYKGLTRLFGLDGKRATA